MALAAGTLLPFTLFAYGQSRVSPEVAGAFLNIEPLVGAVAGIVVFADPFGPAQAAGGAAIIGGIALSMLPLLRPARRPRAVATAAGRGVRAAPGDVSRVGDVGCPGSSGDPSNVSCPVPALASAQAIAEPGRAGAVSRADGSRSGFGGVPVGPAEARLPPCAGPPPGSRGPPW